MSSILCIFYRKSGNTNQTPINQTTQEGKGVNSNIEGLSEEKTPKSNQHCKCFKFSIPKSSTLDNSELTDDVLNPSDESGKSGLLHNVRSYSTFMLKMQLSNFQYKGNKSI